MQLSFIPIIILAQRRRRKKIKQKYNSKIDKFSILQDNLLQKLNAY